MAALPRVTRPPVLATAGLLALAAGALPGGTGARADGSDPAAMAGAPVKREALRPLPATPPPTLPSPEFFASRVEPLLKEACASCHRVGRAGSLDLQFGAVTGGPEARSLRNFKAVLAFVDRERPDRSPLLLKGLPLSEGGLPHASDPYLGRGDDLERALSEFLAGATSENLPPRVAVRSPSAVAAGVPVVLDASATADPDGDPVAFLWEVAARPPSSTAAPAEPRAARTRFVPDAAGLYRLRLRTGDGKIEALPREVVLEVGAAGSPAAGDPSGAAPEMGGTMGGAAGGMTDDPGRGIPPTGPAPGAVGTGDGPSLEVPLADRRWARGLFFDLRARGPSPGELAEALRHPPEVLVDRMLADPATWEAWLEREFWYYLLIDRFRPVSDRVRSLPGRLAAGTATVRDATREIVISAEFNERNPGNDTFVTVVFEQLLGVVVQDQPRLLEAGKRMYDGRPARIFRELGRSQADIVRIVLGRREFAAAFLARQYLQVFGTDAPGGSLEEATDRLVADPASFRVLLREWLLSRTYRERTALPRPKDDQVWIRTLFVDLLGREPTFEEFRNMRNALQALSDPAPVRNVVAQLLLDSGRAGLPAKETITKAREWMRRKFLDLLGREPTERELEAFVATLGEYGCRTETIVLALVTSPDYQYY